MRGTVALLKPLGELLAGFGDVAGVGDRLVSGLSLDSRQVSAGDLFLACRGLRTRGHAFVADAVQAGAAAVAYDASAAPRPEVSGEVPLVAVSDLTAKLGTIAARFYDDPSHCVRVVGITGTNGKTSCSHLLAQAVATSDAAGVIGTLGHGLYRPGRGPDLQPASHTTPDAIHIQALLAAMRAEGAGEAFVEVSSHALVQGRIDGLRVDTAVFTNLSRDHLDFHGDLDAYAAAKALLFAQPGLRRAVINLDDPYGRRLAAGLAADIEPVGYGLGEGFPGMATVWGQDLRLGSAGIEMRIVSRWGEADLRSPLLGRFNAHNLLAALSVLLLHGMSPQDAAARLGRAATVPGRMERFLSAPDRPIAVVDYAHTPDALEQALRALRPHCRGRLWCVFGCGGERDVGKRPLMGACAEALADVVVVTDDNPRGEDGDAIVRDILSGIRRPPSVRVERARDRAIAQALQEAGEGDVVLVAGKGHECFQQIGSRMVPFSDRAFVEDLGFRPLPGGQRCPGDLPPAAEPTLKRKAG
jgi:UDP-N-acetylmuramoyl-L-alanyl-D-glutamate--2,6-diaminopimelate ligase